MYISSPTHLMTNHLSHTTMNTKITGSGELTLVLAHGYGGTQGVWDKLIPQLSQTYRVLVFDWNFSSTVDPKTTPPFDFNKYSSLHAFADDLISLLDNMKMKGIVFVGHSMSGMIGLIASSKRPELFIHLILIGASPRYLNAVDYEGGFEEVESTISTIESNFPVFAENLATGAIGPKVDMITKENFVSRFQKMDPEIGLSLGKTIFRGDYRDVLEKVEVRCTIIQGTDDIVVPVSVAYYMASKIKGSTTVEILESEGHFPQLTEPERVVELIDGALMPKGCKEDTKTAPSCCKIL